MVLIDKGELYFGGKELKQLEKIPELRKELFEKWAEQIIQSYKIKDDETLENITESVAEFFDLLFKYYTIKFTDLHPNGIFPFEITPDSKPKFYADEDYFNELFKVENHLRWTYTILLQKLYREKECPFDTAECPY